jgi:hypothetical protein
MRDMRLLTGILGAAVLVGVPASAATVDPRLLTLGQTDMPARYLFDDDNSLLLTRASLAGVNGGPGRALVRSGFVNGYLPSVVKAGFGQLVGRPSSIRLGDEARVYTTGAPDEGTAVVWRHGRVVAFVSCTEMARHRALCLAQARKQQRRIAAALR